jgi:poly(ADP-ribose) glycohydrolase ARH3
MYRPDHRGRIHGCLLGSAVGDALGARFEGLSAVDPDDLLAWESAQGPLIWTDDTALTLALAQYLADRLEGGEPFDPEALATYFARAWAADPHRGYGASPPHIFSTLLARGDWRGAARSLFGGEGSLGNGGAMRVAPIGLLPLPLRQIAELARASAAITHTHPLGQDGAAVQACAAALAARTAGQPIDPRAFTKAIVGATDTSAYVGKLVAAARAAEGHLPPTEVADLTGHGIAALEAVPAALAAFLTWPDDPSACVHHAILIGGDTDTIACMAGAVAGARCGGDAIPAGWLARLERLEQIRSVADRLAAAIDQQNSSAVNFHISEQ